MTNAQVREATHRAKQDKAWYMHEVARYLKITSREAYDLYFIGRLPPAFPLPAIYRGPLYANYFYLGYVTAENGWHVEDVYRHLGIN